MPWRTQTIMDERARFVFDDPPHSRAPRPRAGRKPRRHSERPGKTPFVAGRPNALWTADFKGQFRTQDGELCYPLTVQDACSRFLLDCRGLPRPTIENTVPVFRRLFRTYGLPDRIRTDNGQPFASAVTLDA